MIVTYSRIVTYTKCPYKYKLTYLEGWVPEVTKDYLEIGRAWHEAMEIVRSGGTTQSAIAHILRYDFPDDVNEMLTEGLVMFENNPPPYKALSCEEPIEVEYTEGIVFRAKPDEIAEWKGQRWLVERKTVSGFGPAYQRFLHESWQPVAYMWAWEKTHTEPLAGVVFEVFIKRPKNPELFREIVLVPNQRLREWEEFLHHYTPLLLDGPYNKVLTNCTHPYRGRCEYYDFCHFNLKEGFVQVPPEVIDTLP